MAKTVVIAATDGSNSSFIRAHARLLPAKTYLIEGAALPLFDHNGKPFFSGLRWVQQIESGLKRFGINGFFFRERAIKKYLKTVNADAVLAEYGHTGVRMMDICAELGIPLFVYFLGYDGYIDWVLKKYGHRYQEFNDKAKGVICVSRDLVGQLKKLGVREDILHYNPCGPNNLDMEQVNPEKSQPLFVAVGAFDERKGPHFTIQAFAKAAAQVNGMELHMVGDGPLWERCKKLARELGVEDRVFFLGKKTLQEIHDLERRARAFVQHSIVAPVTGDSEGTPVAIVEASAAGLPVIATRHAGIKDTIIHGKTGFLVGETDVDAMAEYMVLLASEPELAGTLGAAGAQFTRSEFAQEKLIHTLWGILSSAWENPQ